MNTAGYTTLRGLISDLIRASSGLDQDIFKRWKGRRFAAWGATVEGWCGDLRVQAFFDDYATALASELLQLLPQGPIAEPAQLCIDYLEALYVQTGRYAASVEPLPECEPETNQQMALAA